MLSINELHPGTAIVFNGSPHIVTWREHGAMGRGSGFVRAKLKNLVNGAIIENTFKGNDKISEAELERSQAQLLYFSGDLANLMGTTTYEQFAIAKDRIGPSAQFMIEGATVDIVSFQNKPITVTMPIKIDLKITYTEPGFKGNTASATTKPARLATGATIKVPLFIENGDTVRIDSRSGEFIERVR